MFSGYTSAQAGGWANKGSKPEPTQQSVELGWDLGQQALGILARDFQGTDPN